MVAVGFKGKYFSLQAITATVSSVKLQKEKSLILNYFLPQKVIQSEDDPPPEDSLESKLTNILIDQYTKPCYCNLFFKCLTYITLKLSKIKKPPLCRCRKTKTGISPPASKSDFEQTKI